MGTARRDMAYNHVCIECSRPDGQLYMNFKVVIRITHVMQYNTIFSTGVVAERSQVDVSAESLFCLWIRLFVNTITSEPLNIG